MAKKKGKKGRSMPGSQGGKASKGASGARVAELRKIQRDGKGPKTWRAHQGKHAEKLGKKKQRPLTAESAEPSCAELGIEDGGGENLEEAKTIPHGYQENQRILLVGEGDFSFSCALLRLLGSGANIFATAYDSEETVLEKYEGARKTVEELRSSGARVLFNVDATRLQQCLHVGKNRRKAGETSILDQPFDRVVFNFPHVGMGIKDQAVNVSKNRALLAGFFASAAGLLKRGQGEVHVAVKTGGPYTLWNVPALASQTTALRLKTALTFLPAKFPGYAHRRTLGFKEGLSAKDSEEIVGKARTYVFVPTT